jgi:IclR family KDG regulon transcriptional repressor
VGHEGKESTGLIPKRYLKDKYLINSILRAFSVLRSFSGEKTHLRISELARRLCLDRSTTYRILLSLEKCGLVEKEEKTGEYALGLAAFELGNAYLKRMDFIQISKPVMAELALKVQETVHLAVLSGAEIVYVDKAESPRTLGVMSKIGQRAPLYCTSLGKVLLAYQSEQEASRIIDQIKFKPFTPNTITAKKKLREELKRVHERGYAFDSREHEREVECIGAPIRDHLGLVIAALSISGPQKKINTPAESQFVSEVVKAANFISSKLGYVEVRGEVLKARPKAEIRGRR